MALTAEDKKWVGATIADAIGPLERVEADIAELIAATALGLFYQ
jgi:hypothetical protein